MSDSDKVYTFTKEANGKCLNRPKKLNRDSVMFLLRMIFSEAEELAATVCEESEIHEFMQEAYKTRDRCKNFNYLDDYETTAAQADAVVDLWYYCQNVFCKNGINLSKVFDLVHKANMAKRDPVLGFIKRQSDGKIMKPKGWKPPDIRGEIIRQVIEGSF